MLLMSLGQSSHIRQNETDRYTHFSHTLSRKQSIKSLLKAFLKALTKSCSALLANNSVLVKYICSDVWCLVDHMKMNLHESFTIYLSNKSGFHHSDVVV